MTLKVEDESPSLSHGTARFDRRYARHEPMPPQLGERLRQQAEEEGP